MALCATGAGCTLSAPAVDVVLWALGASHNPTGREIHEKWNVHLATGYRWALILADARAKWEFMHPRRPQ